MGKVKGVRGGLEVSGKKKRKKNGPLFSGPVSVLGDVMTSDRIWEIDVLRGLAIVLMVVFHLVVDLKDFYGAKLEYLSGFWFWVGRSSALLFMLLSGVSTVLGRRPLRRAVAVFTWGMVLTAITYLYNPQTYIRFGILHLLGVSMVLGHCLRRVHPAIVTFLAFVFLALGQLSKTNAVSHSFFLPFGIIPKNFTSLDYYPIFPWTGVFLLGTALGRTLYKGKLSRIPGPPRVVWLATLGRHSLFIYLVHQPVLLTLLYLGHLLWRRFA